MSEIANGDEPGRPKPIGATLNRASAFVFPHKIGRRISYSKRKVEPLRGESFVRRLRFAAASQASGGMIITTID
jgi:hypothetical protein